ncbi:MAG: Txe/YoeB family addiction module toxin [Puniceicoccales bacterium]|jgi:toxin YoeB|nr:Txe/YoeB family addiction module toxin [Puniceicoccales bacterium]
MYQPDFSKKFKQDYDKFSKSSLYTAEKIDELIADTLEHPADGLGKPEHLRHRKSTTWSRHIDKKNRLVYTLREDVVYFESCKGHYDDH